MASQRSSTLYFLMILSMFSCMGISLLVPALPAIVQYFSLKPEDVWTVATAFAVPGAITVPFGGVLADRFGRKAVLLPSLFLLFIGSLGCALSPNFETLLFFRVVQGIGSGPLASINSTVASDIFESSERARVLGLLAVMVALSVAVFPFLGGIFTEWSWRWVFIIPTLSAPLIYWMWRLPLKGSNPDIRVLPYLRGCGEFLKNRAVWLALAQDFLMTACIFGPFSTYIPLLQAELFGASSTLIGTLSLLGSIGTVAGGALVGRLAARYSLRALFVSTSLMTMASFLLIIFSPTLWFFALPLGLFGLGQNLAMPLVKTRISVLSTAENVGAAMAINGLGFRLAQVVAPALCGVFWMLMGPYGPFWAGLGMGGVMLLISFLEPAGVLASERTQM